MSDKLEIPTVRYRGSIDFVHTGREKWRSQDLYEDNTYIDWMKESSIRLVSGSKKWATLVVMSLLVGYVTMFIDLTSVWLNDLKKGLCFSKLDKWSLLNPYLTCPAEDWFNWLQVVSGKDGVLANLLLTFPLYLVFVCFFVMVAGYITIEKAPLIKQSGIPEMKIIIAGFNYYLESYLGPLALLYKILGLILVVSSGFWLGKEGPLVHIACCILTICFKRIFGENVSEGLRRELLSAATATGIAVAFNSPVGGILFVVELLPSYFIPTKIMWNSFVCATIALVTLTGFKLFTDGENFHEQDLFQVLFGNFSWLFMETIPFLLLGVVGGFYGYAYTTVYLRFSDPHYKHRLWTRLSSLLRLNEKHGQYAELLLVAIVTASLTFVLLLTRMPLGAFLKLLFTDCPTEPSNLELNSVNFMCQPSSLSTLFKLVYIMIQGFFLSAYSYGLSLPGGVLMPSLVLGGTAGRFAGILSEAIQKSVNVEYLATCTAKSCLVSPSSYAVVGAAAFVSGITKLTLCVVVIMFELTGAVTYVLPIMIAVMTSKFVNDWLCDENIYDSCLSKEFNILAPLALGLANKNKGTGICSFAKLTVAFKSRLPDIGVRRVMVPLHNTRHLCIFPEEPYSLTSLYGFLSDDAHEGYPLIASEDNPVTLGYVTKEEIYQQVARTVGELQPTSAIICFRTDLPSFLASQQSVFEQELYNRYANVFLVPLNAEQSTIIVKDNTSLKQVIEIFERLHLNYLVLTEHNENTKMCGFIDRFILSRLVSLRFSELQDEIDMVDSIADEFEIGQDDDVEEHATLRRQRGSIELIT